MSPTRSSARRAAPRSASAARYQHHPVPTKETRCFLTPPLGVHSSRVVMCGSVVSLLVSGQTTRFDNQAKPVFGGPASVLHSRVRPGDSLGFPSAVDLNFRWKRVQRKVGNSVEITRARRRPTGREVRESEICFHTDGDPDASIACQSAVNEVPSLDYYEMSNVK